VQGEPTFAGSVAQGCDLVAASGDKLLGGPQCGILVGAQELVERIRTSPLYRTFRADKLNIAALEATLIQYLYGDLDAIPVLRLLHMQQDAIRERCRRVADALHGGGLAVEVAIVESVIGGGTAPKSRLPSCAIALRHAQLDASMLLAALRRLDPPLIGRIDDGQVLLDLRTVEPEFDELLVSALSGEIEPSPKAGAQS
jgi:L-seryl-tRNA(Ser) seleniumtransferase